MGEIVSSAAATRIAEQAYHDGQIIKQAETFVLYRLPQGQSPLLSNFVLMLFDGELDFPAGKAPTRLLIPVDIGGRHGYLLEESVAAQYEA